MRNLKAIALSVLFSLISVLLHAQENVYTKQAVRGGYFGNNVFIFQDTTARLSFQQVKQRRHLFKKSSHEVPNLGVTPSNNWLRFSLVNNSDLDHVILNIPNPIIDEADLYIIRQEHTDSIRSNNFQPFKTRPYEHQFYLYDIPLKKGERVECYLKLKSNQQILAPLTLTSEKEVVKEISISDTRTGLYLGIMMVMLLYNLFIYFTTRDRDYLVYCHYIFWVTLTQATLLGYSYRFLWPENVWLAENMVIICGAMSGIATILFAVSFLRTRKYSPRLSIALYLTIAVYVISLISLLSGYKPLAFQIVNVNAASVSVLLMIVGWNVYRKKYEPARYFLISWSIFFTSILVFVSKDYGLVPYNAFTIHSVEIGSALEAIFLSFALAGKINILKKEKEASQAEALAIAKENERIIREQNIILEAKVHERTAELEESNHELNNTLEDLKQAQSQLVESEKMASLGQLTAGIAHEINNPINFVTSNVAPLRRDVDMLVEVIDTIEKVGLSSEATEAKQQQIDQYKEEIDFDYLKIEINHLLKGIHEGASRTAEIVKGLRIFSRVDEDDLKRANINDGLDSTLIIVNNLLGKVKVVKEYEDIPAIECYPGKLNQVFLNIITNAIHSIRKRHGESGEGCLVISTRAKGEAVQVCFKDNGTGMDERTQKKVFEPFFTTKDVGEGTGLGMSIAYNTIKKHNGRIHFNTKLGEGTEFVLEFPVIHQLAAVS